MEDTLYVYTKGLPQTLRTRRDWTHARGKRKLKFVFALGQRCVLPESRHIAGETESMTGHATCGKRLMAMHLQGWRINPHNALRTGDTLGLGERRILAARIPLFSASVTASEQAYRIRFAFRFHLEFTLEPAAWILRFHWVWPSGERFSSKQCIGWVFRIAMRRFLWTRQRDRGDVYIYMRLSQCNGTLLLFRPDFFHVETAVYLCVCC